MIRNRDRMFQLIKKSKLIFFTLLAIYLASFFAGYTAGKLDYVKYEELSTKGVFGLSRNLEYKIPVYGSILRSYKAYHDKLKRSYISQKNFFAMGVLIFLNNFIVANVAMIIRALLVVPILLNICGKFLQGVIVAQNPVPSVMYIIFTTEFGGYFLTTCATLTGVMWTLFNKRFGFSTRGDALVSGLRLLGYAYLISGIGILVGSVCETLFLKNLLTQLGNLSG